MDLLSSSQLTTFSLGDERVDSAPLSPPDSPILTPTFPLGNAKVTRYVRPAVPPRFPRHTCPTSHYVLSLLAAEHEGQRLFGNSFKLRSPTTGELVGPFAVLSYTDGWVRHYCNYIHKVVSSPLFTLRERELIILTVVNVTRPDYMVYAHRRIAASVGLGEDVIESALAGSSWMDMIDLSDREKTIYRIASEMAGNWGRVSKETWSTVVMKDKPKAKGQEGCLEKELEQQLDTETGVTDGDDTTGGAEHWEEGTSRFLTRTEVATLTQVVASTMFASVLVNCADVEVPVDEDDIVYSRG